MMMMMTLVGVGCDDYCEHADDCEEEEDDDNDDAPGEYDDDENKQ